jgi:hypothetical protein
MAFGLETIRNLGLTNLFGRRLSIDKNEYLIGGRGNRVTVEDLTTVATTVSPFGMSVVMATGSTQGPVQYTLPSPADHIGAFKHLSIGTSSTASFQFLSTANGASIRSASDGTTSGVVNLRHPGATVTLFALTSAVWQAVSVTGSTTLTGVSFTTSTA